jgi:putative oxidoreductase
MTLVADTIMKDPHVNSKADLSSSDALALVARMCMAWLFVPSGWGKLVGFAGVSGFIAAKSVPLPTLAAAVAVAVELGMGLLLLVGWKTRWAALAIALFVVVVTPIFHAYWDASAAQLCMQKLNFDKNVAIVGGLLAIAAIGGRRFSLDAVKASRPMPKHAMH